LAIIIGNNNRNNKTPFLNQLVKGFPAYITEKEDRPEKRRRGILQERNELEQGSREVMKNSSKVPTVGKVFEKELI